MTDRKATNSVDRQLGSRLRMRRLELGLSQERLGDLLGITFQQVQKYEKGLNRIAASRLFEIAAVLDISVASFFDGIGGGSHKKWGVAEPGGPGTTVFMTVEAEELINLFLQIPSERRKKLLLEFARNLAEVEAEAGQSPEPAPRAAVDLES